MVPPVGPMRVGSYWCQRSAVSGEVCSLGATMTMPALSSKCCSVTKITKAAQKTNHPQNNQPTTPKPTKSQVNCQRICTGSNGRKSQKWRKLVICHNPQRHQPKTSTVIHQFLELLQCQVHEKYDQKTNEIAIHRWSKKS